MAFSGDKQIVESILYDVSGSAIALAHSASVDMSTQAGVALAGVYSSSSGFTARILQVDEEGRLMVDAQIVPAGIQAVTGTVALSQPAIVTDGGGSLTVDGTVTANVTGTVALDRGDSVNNPLFVTGSFNANLSRGDAENNPLWMSGTVQVVQPVAVTDNGGSLTVDGAVSVYTDGAQLVSGTVVVTDGGGSITVDGAVSVSGPVSVYNLGTQAVSGSVSVHTDGAQLVSGTVSLTRGDLENNPLWMSGSVAVNNVVKVETAIHTVASGTFFATTTTPVTIAAASTARRGLTIYNESNKAMYIKFGTGASLSDYTYKIFSDDGWTMPEFLYSGIITAVWAGAGSSGAMVTIITP